MHPPEGIRYSLATDHFRYPTWAGNYEFNPANVAMAVMRFSMEHLVPIDQKGASLVHTFFWDMRKFERRWIQESDQSFGQYLDSYNNVTGLVRRLGTEGFSSYLNSKWCTGVITWSDWARRGFVEDGVDSSKVFVIPPPFGTTKYHLEHPGCNVLFLGRDFRRKGGASALSAFRSLKGREEVRMTYVGPVKEKSREKLKLDGITQYDVAPSRILDRDIWPTTDIFLLPTRTDAFAITVVEAMRRGIPVVATKIPAISEVVQDGISGLLSKVGDEESLKQNLQKLVYDQALRTKMGENARKRVELLFSPGKVNRALMEVYKLAL